MTRLNELTLQTVAYATDSGKRIHGELKSTPEDFIVEEIPVYEPSGTGDHCFLWMEKRDVPAELFHKHIAETLGLQRDHVGIAGLKDRRAVTRQWVSVPATSEPLLSNLETEQIKVLKTSRHTNKLKTGHLRGNRFSIVLLNVAAEALEIAKELEQQLLQTGFPNYFGSQRFGIDQETLTLGEELLTGTRSPESIPRPRRKFLTRLSLSAVQSALFNQCLHSRLISGTVHRVTEGDVMQVVKSGGPFVCTDPAIDQERFDKKEIVTTGPLFGPKMKMPTGSLLDAELGLLSECGLKLDDFHRHRKLTMGARRPLLIWLDELKISPVDQGVKFEFELPTGVYATVILREFMKEE